MVRNSLIYRLFLLGLLLLASLFALHQSTNEMQALGLERDLAQAKTITPTGGSITDLLQKADEYFDAMLFVAPPQGNALDIYRQVLAVDPLNAQAQKKIIQMTKICKAWGDSAYAEEYTSGAVRYYKCYVQSVSVAQAHQVQVEDRTVEVNARLDELKQNDPGLADQPAIQDVASQEAESAVEPSDLATPSAQSFPSVVSDYYEKYRAGNDVWGELNQNPLFLPLLIVGVVVLVVLILGALYFLWLSPWIKRKPLEKALALIEAHSDWGAADNLLTEALNKGLDKASIAEAHFAQIYVKIRLEKYDGALGMMEDFLGKITPDRETLYLALWLYAKQDKYEKAIKHYEQYSKELSNWLDSKIIAGGAYLNLGRLHWEKREIKEAVQNFDRVRELGVLQEHIPAHTDNYQIGLGISALFDHNPAQAREFFHDAKKESQKKNIATFESDLGLLACEWHEQEHPDIDDALGRILEAMERSRPQPGKDSKGDILLRNTRLWYAVSLLFTWFNLPQKGGLPDAERAKVLQRIKNVKELDDKNSHASLINGLVLYYFEPNKKEEALANIKESLENDVGVPEVRNLLQREEKAAEQQRKVLDLYLQLVKKYLSDTDIPLKLRAELKRYLDKFKHFHTLDKDIALGEGDENALPSLQDIQTRGHALRSRVEKIINTKLDKDESMQMQKLLSTLEEATSVLVKGKNELEATEQKLMLQTGEFLFAEEQLATEANDEKVETKPVPVDDETDNG